MFWRNSDLSLGRWECLPLFSPSVALISRIINPDLCNPIGTFCSLHQRGPTRPEINQRLIVQSGFHPFGRPSIPWPKEGNTSSGNWLIWLGLFLSYSQDNHSLPLLSLVIHVELLLLIYLILIWLVYLSWTLWCFQIFLVFQKQICLW